MTNRDRLRVLNELRFIAYPDDDYDDLRIVIGGAYLPEHGVCLLTVPRTEADIEDVASRLNEVIRPVIQELTGSRTSEAVPV